MISSQKSHIVSKRLYQEIEYTKRIIKRFKPYIEKLIYPLTYTFAFVMIVEFGLINYIRYGYEHLAVFQVPLFALFDKNITYEGYPLSFITFGIYIIIINYKYKLLSIPLFLVTYIGWEVFGQGASNIIHTTSTFFIILLYSAIICLPIIYKYMKMKSSIIYFIPYWFIVTYPNPPYPQLLFEPSEIVAFCIFIYMSVKSK